ncbi:MAG: ATP-binding protein [Saprospiraceae bacterium]
MKKIFCLVLTCCIYCAVLATNDTTPKYDSIALQNLNFDSIEIEDFWDFIDYFVDREKGKGVSNTVKKVKAFCQQKPTKHNWTTYYAKMLPSSREWDVDFFESEYPIALKYLQQTNQMDGAVGLYLQKCYMYQEHEVGVDSAMVYAQKALEVAKDSNQLYLAYYMMGSTMSKAEREEEAIVYYKKGLDFAPNQVWTMYEIAWSYYYIGKLDSAIILMDNAAVVAKEIKDFRAEKYTLANVTVLLIESNHLDKRIPANLAKLDMLVDSTEMRFSSTVYETKAAYYRALKQYQLAIDAYQKSIWFSENRPPKPDYNAIANSEVELSKLYEAKGDFKAALHYFKKGQQRLDSINTAQIQTNLNDLQLKYETQQKEQKITLLSKDNALLNTRNQIYIAIVAGLALLSLIIGAFFMNLRKKNQQINQQKAQLEQLNLTKDRLFAIIGHDLRKPALSFRGIAKKVNYLIQNEKFDLLFKLGNEIERNALAMNKLTDNLLKWALMQKNVLPYDPALLKLTVITEEVLSMFKPLIEEKKLSVIQEIPNDIEVFADANALRTIIRNLIDNAIKYTPKGGEIQLMTQSDKDGLVLKIRDAGLGMDEQQLAAIFLLQKNKSKRGTGGEKGTGLGLHIVHELVQINKGTIKVFSQLGKGTTFEVSFPMV